MSRFKVSLLLFVFLFSSEIIYAQDYILPEKGDTIKCYITKIKRDSIYYKFRDINSAIKDSTISINSIKTYDIEYYEVYDIIVEEKPQKEKKVRVGLGFGMGWSHRAGKLDPSIPTDKESEYKNGYYLRGHIGLYFKNVGFGVLLNQHQTNAIILNNKVITKITFIAPSFEVQSNPINNFFSVGGYLAIGKLNFEEKLVPNSGYTLSNTTLTGKGSGTGLGLGGSFILLLSNNFNLIFDTGIISGNIINGEITDNNGNIIETIPKENASLLTLGIKLRILL